jgi:NADH-ubiquinone oxidoreductase chain 4
MIARLFLMGVVSLVGGVVLNLFCYSLFIICIIICIVLLSYGECYAIDDLFFYDGMSIRLVLLSAWVSFLIIYSSYNIYFTSEFFNLFVFFVLSLIFILCVTFFCGGYLIFYFFFEVSLIPTLLIIMGWGYQPERLQAGVYFLFYTLTASLPLLLLIIFFFSKRGTYSFFLSSFSEVSGGGISIIFIVGLMGVFAFLVKLPMYFTHLWLPRAHVEAPVAGSIILAGVLLKLGGYGLIRFSSMSGAYLNKLGAYFFGLRLVGIIYVGIMCCRINDFKSLVAYSSVAHIAIVICGILTFCV